MIRFLEVYESVFNADETVKNCGRDMCHELILLADQAEHGVDHGNPQTCMMNVKAMHDLKQKIEKNQTSFLNQ